MIRINPYRPTLPIRGGGGISHVDTRKKEGGATALAKVIDSFRQRQQQEEQFGLEKQLMQSQIGRNQAYSDYYRNRPNATKLRPIKGRENWLLLDPLTGKITDTSIPVSQTSLLPPEIVDFLNEDETVTKGPEQKPGAIMGFINRLLGGGKTAEPSLETVLEEPADPDNISAPNLLEFNDLLQRGEPEKPQLVPPTRGIQPGELTPLTKKLDKATARKILVQAGGDKEKARQIARRLGYKF